jgi:hypothetical protein
MFNSKRSSPVIMLKDAQPIGYRPYSSGDASVNPACKPMEGPAGSQQTDPCR